jgi:DNA modification methylase
MTTHHDNVAEPTVKRTSHPLAILVDGTPRWARIGGGAEYHEDEALERIWRRGQTMKPYYQDNLITLYHGKCEDVLPTLEAQSFDAVITDPPYGTTACAWDSPIEFAFMWHELKRLARARAAIVLFGSQPFTSALIGSNFELFKYELIWEKDKATGYLSANNAPLKAHENILVFSLTSPNYYPQKTTGHEPSNKSSKTKQAGNVYREYLMRQGGGDTDRYPRTVQRYNTVNSAHGYLHPTQKPLALMEYLVRTYTNEGDTVLDFTSGSGTTLRACKNLGRRCVGIEMLEQYCEATVKRLAPAFEEAIVDNGAALDDLPLFAMEVTQ